MKDYKKIFLCGALGVGHFVFAGDSDDDSNGRSKSPSQNAMHHARSDSKGSHVGSDDNAQHTSQETHQANGNAFNVENNADAQVISGDEDSAGLKVGLPRENSSSDMVLPNVIQVDPNAGKCDVQGVANLTSRVDNTQNDKENHVQHVDGSTSSSQDVVYLARPKGGNPSTDVVQPHVICVNSNAHSVNCDVSAHTVISRADNGIGAESGASNSRAEDLPRNVQSGTGASQSAGAEPMISISRDDVPEAPREKDAFRNVQSEAVSSIADEVSSVVSSSKGTGRNDGGDGGNGGNGGGSSNNTNGGGSSNGGNGGGSPEKTSERKWYKENVSLFVVGQYEVKDQVSVGLLAVSSLSHHSVSFLALYKTTDVVNVGAQFKLAVCSGDLSKAFHKDGAGLGFGFGVYGSADVHKYLRAIFQVSFDFHRNSVKVVSASIGAGYLYNQAKMSACAGVSALIAHKTSKD